MLLRNAVYWPPKRRLLYWRYLMPQRPRTPCNYPRCPRLVNPGERYCPEHKRHEQRRYDIERGTAAQRGYGSRWNRYTKMYKREHPLCVKCKAEGKLVQADVVDHVEPVTGPDDPLFWEPMNHQSLCHPCHNKKRATEDKKTWKHRRGRGG